VNGDPADPTEPKPEANNPIPDPKYFPDPLEDEKEEEREKKELEKKRKEKKKQRTDEPNHLVAQFCPTCASAEFQCREAKCDNWDCLWWCRCYDEFAVYDCEDDGEPCACDSPQIRKNLYNVTYDDLINSGYMDVSFTGPGSEELMAKAKAAMADLPLH
jgi:hypothetical protein